MTISEENLNKFIHGEISWDEARQEQHETASATAQEWREALAGTRLQELSDQWGLSSMEFNGPWESTNWFLNSDGSYTYLRQYQVSLDSYDASMAPSSLHDVQEEKDHGVWDIDCVDDQSRIVFTSHKDDQKRIFILSSPEKGAICLNHLKYGWYSQG